MTEKRFHFDNALEKIYDYDTCEDGIAESLDCFDACELLNELHEENVELKNSLKEFEVFESDRIKGAVVTNDDFSVTIHSNNEAYMVCNMINQFIEGVKNGSKD